jgi:protein-S-isoprenylcysteine O-methyltransferase Ste14
MTEPLLFRLLFAALLIGFVAHRAYYTRKFPARENETLTRLANSASSKIANILALLALISSALYIFVPSYVAWASIPLPTFARWLGVGIALTGFLLLESSHRALASNWSDQPRITRDQQLIRPVRIKDQYPIYTSFLLIWGRRCSSHPTAAGCQDRLCRPDISTRIRFEERAMQISLGRSSWSTNHDGSLFAVLMPKYSHPRKDRCP